MIAIDELADKPNTENLNPNRMKLAKRMLVQPGTNSPVLFFSQLWAIVFVELLPISASSGNWWRRRNRWKHLPSTLKHSTENMSRKQAHTSKHIEGALKMDPKNTIATTDIRMINYEYISSRSDMPWRSL